MSGDRTLRKNTFETYYHRMGEFRNTVAATLDAQFKQLKFFADARRYGSTLEAALDATEVPQAVYLNLIEAVHANLDKMYRYVRPAQEAPGRGGAAHVRRLYPRRGRRRREDLLSSRPRRPCSRR